ncbi:MAG TPA: DUF4258 domain-containing protein [Chlamydiales bacterium]|nr:DUF4258 domain-containing protein [Chlamydiales bacterium]
MKRPSKIADVLKKAKGCLETGRYYDTTHAVLRKSQRRISLAHIRHVVQQGYHEKQKDQYHPEHKDWTYSIRGKTVDERDIRIAVAFDKEDMLIITVIEIA